MKRNGTIRINPPSIAALFFTICFLLNSGYLLVIQNDLYTLIALIICGISVFIYWGVEKKEFTKKEFWIHPFTILSIWILLSIVLHFEFINWGAYFRQIFILVIAVLFATNVDFNKFIAIFLKFMTVVTIIAILVWLITNLFGISLSLPVVNSTWEKSYFTEYKNGIIFFIYIHQPEKLMGPFWEPGLYASIALIGILLNGIPIDTNRPKKTLTDIALSIGILLSFSTAGYILLIVVYIVRYLQHTSKKISILSTFLLAAVIVLLFIFQDRIISFLVTIAPNVFGKLTFENFSKSTRINGPLVDLAIYTDSPVIGAGMQSYLKKWPVFAQLLSVESRTSTLTYFIAVYGVPGGIYGFTIINSILHQKNTQLAVKIFVLIFFLCIVSKEPHYFNLFTCTVIAYFYISKDIFVKKKHF